MRGANPLIIPKKKRLKGKRQKTKNNPEGKPPGLSFLKVSARNPDTALNS